MAKSMTGFGRARIRAKGFEVDVEIRAVNHRHLQFRQRLPQEFVQYEAEIEELIRKRLSRGAINLTVNVTRAGSGRTVRLHLDVAKNYLDQLQKMKKALRLNGEPSLDRIASLPGVFESSESDASRAEKEFVHLRKAIEKALEVLESARAREGKALEKDLSVRRNTLMRLCNEVIERAPALVNEYRDRLKKRTDELLSGSNVKLREEDLAREVAVFATRSDITEELTRFKTHLLEFQRLLRANGEVGRQIDFLLQEMNRETNTIGSKSADASIAHLVVEMKGEIDKIREQVQNLE